MNLVFRKKEQHNYIEWTVIDDETKTIIAEISVGNMFPHIQRGLETFANNMATIETPEYVTLEIILNLATIAMGETTLEVKNDELFMTSTYDNKEIRIKIAQLNKHTEVTAYYGKIDIRDSYVLETSNGRKPVDFLEYITAKTSGAYIKEIQNEKKE